MLLSLPAGAQLPRDELPLVVHNFDDAQIYGGVGTQDIVHCECRF